MSDGIILLDLVDIPDKTCITKTPHKQASEVHILYSMKSGSDARL